MTNYEVCYLVYHLLGLALKLLGNCWASSGHFLPSSELVAGKSFFFSPINIIKLFLHCPLNTKQCCCRLISTTSTELPSGTPRIEPGAAGCEARTLSIVLCGPPVAGKSLDTNVFPDKIRFKKDCYVFLDQFPKGRKSLLRPFSSHL